MLCKEMLQRPMGLNKRELEVVRVRMRALRRLELVWGRDDSAREASMNGSATSLRAPGNGIGLGAGIVGEERVQRLFARALQDGYILCQ